jgi:hypothetical protein
LDVQVTKDASGETMMVGVQGVTEQGIDFVEAYVPPSGDMHVVDADRLVIREADLDHLLASAKKLGVAVAVD